MDTGNKDDNLRHAVPFVRQITEDGKAKLEIYRPTTNPIYIYTQVCQLKLLKKCLSYTFICLIQSADNLLILRKKINQ